MIYKTLSFSFYYEQQDGFQVTDLLTDDIYRTKDIKPGSIVLDIGANIGLFSLVCAVDRKCSVIALEPDPRTVKILLENIESNRHLGSGNVRVLQQAVSDRGGSCEFNSRKDHSGGSHLKVKVSEDDPTIPRYFTSDNHSGTFEKIQVDCVTLGEIFSANRIRICDFVKLDCEGAEYLVFNKDNANLFKTQVRRLAFECHSEKATSCVSFLRDLGYTIQADSYVIGHVLHATNPFLGDSSR